MERYMRGTLTGNLGMRVVKRVNCTLRWLLSLKLKCALGPMGITKEIPPEPFCGTLFNWVICKKNLVRSLARVELGICGVSL